MLSGEFNRWRAERCWHVWCG